MGDFAFLLFCFLAVLGVRLWRKVFHIFSYLLLESNFEASWRSVKHQPSAPVWLKLVAPAPGGLRARKLKRPRVVRGREAT